MDESFSNNKGNAKGPNNGLDERHSLEKINK